MIYIILTWLLSPIWLSVAFVRGLFLKSPKKVLFMEIAGIGDVVCSAVVFKEFKNAYPDAQIDLMIDPVASGLAPLLPMVNSVINFAYKEQKGIKGRIRLALICAKYDTVICLIPSAAQLCAVCLAGVPQRYSVLPNPYGSTYALLKPLLSGFALHKSGDFFVQTQADILHNFKNLHNLDTTKIDKWLPKDSITKDAIFEENIKYVGILVSSAREMKRIPPKELASLIDNILDAKVFLIGSMGDKAVADEVISLCKNKNATNLAGQYPLAKLPNLLVGLDLFIGVDSGVTHMADAFRLNVICIGGPMDLQEVYKTKPSVQKISAQNLECFPCLGVFITPSNCKTGTLECIKRTSKIRV